jgi:MacB-like periplasmic core domain
MTQRPAQVLLYYLSHSSNIGSSRGYANPRLEICRTRFSKSSRFYGNCNTDLCVGNWNKHRHFWRRKRFPSSPLPVRAPEQITAIAIQQKGAPIGSGGFSYPELDDFRRQSTAFSDVFGMAISPLQLADRDRSEQCFGNYVTSNFFSSLGVQPAVGRLLLPSDREILSGPFVAVLGYGYWQRRFHSDPAVIDPRIRIGGQPATIVGVASRTFQGMYSGFETDVHLPLGAITAEESPARYSGTVETFIESLRLGVWYPARR